MRALIVVSVHAFEFHVAARTAGLCDVIDLFFAKVSFFDKFLVLVIGGGRGFCGFAGDSLGILRGEPVTATASSATTTASAPAARSIIILVFRCGGGVSRALFWRCAFRLFALFGVVVFFFDFGAALLLNDKPVGLRQTRAGDFYFTEIVVFVFFLQIEEVGNIEECVALKADIDECRLHTWKYASDTSFVDGSCEGVFIGSLVVDLGELIVFQQRDLGLVRSGRYIKFFVHLCSGPWRNERSWLTGRGKGRQIVEVPAVSRRLRAFVHSFVSSPVVSPDRSLLHRTLLRLRRISRHRRER
jgi:hypothetical protein